MSGLIILGRTQAKAIGYVEFPKIKWPHTFTTYPTTFKNDMHHQDTGTRYYQQLFHPQTQWVLHTKVHVHKNESTKATQVKTV